MTKQELTAQVATSARVARALSNVSQTEIAGRLGLHRSVISRAEDGQHLPSLDTLNRIAATFNLTLGEFMSISVKVKETEESRRLTAAFLKMARKVKS